MKKTLALLAVLFCIGMCSAFSQTQEKLPPPPPPPPPVKEIRAQDPVPPPSLTEFYRQNPGVSGVHWGRDNKIKLELKNGAKEEYDLSNAKSKIRFLEKYKLLPGPPPPPPPPAKN